MLNTLVNTCILGAAHNYKFVEVTLGILLFWNKFARAHKNTQKLGKENTLL